MSVKEEGTLVGSTVSPTASTCTNVHDLSNLSSLSSALDPSGLSLAAGLDLLLVPLAYWVLIPLVQHHIPQHEEKVGEGTRQKTKGEKEYSYHVCGRPMTTPSHTQFYGQRYCPDTPG